MNDNKPLVSVVVVTYNSSKYVIETLESIKRQTYSNIELIVADDSSSDETLNLCEKWIKLNSSRFKRVEIITSDTNTGITPNRNRGCFAAKGQWIKQIDGDDRLKSCCIEDYVNYVTKNPDNNIIFSPLVPFGDGDVDKWNCLLQSNFEYAFSLTDKQFKILLCKVCLFPAPSAFINKLFFDKVGGYDESIVFLEDWPFWVRTAFNGAKFAYIPTCEVEYRISSSSLSQGINGENNKFFDAIKLTKKKTLLYMKKISYFYYIEGLLSYKGEYSSSLIWKLMVYLRPLNPYFWIARKLYKQYFAM